MYPLIHFKHRSSILNARRLKSHKAYLIYFSEYSAFIRFKRFNAESIPADYYLHMFSLKLNRFFRIFNDRLIIFYNRLLVPICFHDRSAIEYIRLQAHFLRYGIHFQAPRILLVTFILCSTACTCSAANDEKRALPSRKKRTRPSRRVHHMRNYLNFLLRAASDFFFRLTLGFS